MIFGRGSIGLVKVRKDYRIYQESTGSDCSLRRDSR
nr:MAG TPA: hypothetical protein [Caudoviricetes sp.]